MMLVPEIFTASRWLEQCWQSNNCYFATGYTSATFIILSYISDSVSCYDSINSGTGVDQPLPHNALTQAALKRIAEHEQFLEACGITPVAGSELEFHFTPKMSANFKKLWAIDEFRKSAFVERLEADDTMPKVGEVVIGKGPLSRSAQYPKERYPSTIARATRSTKQIIEDGASHYGMDITFGERENGKRIRSLQSNLSLWRSSDNTPLFLNAGGIDSTQQAPNDLTLECSKSLIDAQRALSAVVCPSEASFKRYNAKDCAYGIDVHNKFSSVTALLRRNEPERNKPLSYYFEDRLPSSDADPALAMLMTLGGIVTGVKNYMCANALVTEDGKPSPGKMKEHINSTAFGKKSGDAKKLFSGVPPHGDTSPPKNHQQALQQITSSELAKEILGQKLYSDFCAFYERVAAQQAATGSPHR